MNKHELEVRQKAEKISFKSHGFIGVFARHKVAFNLLMMVMIILGAMALVKLNVQFFPNFNLDYVTVRVVWPGANAEDVEKSVTKPIERVLKHVDHLDEMTSTSSLSSSLVVLKFKEGTDMIAALDRVKQKVAELRSLPQDSELPKVERILRYEPIAKLVLVSHDGDLTELRRLARTYEQQLLDKGIDQVTFVGMPTQEMAIEVSQESLQNNQITLGEISQKLSSMSVDLPAGTVGEQDSVRDIRAIEQGRTEAKFNQMPIVSTATERVTLGDLGQATLRDVKNAPIIKVNDLPAIELQLQRAETGDTLKASNIMQAWLEQTRPTLPQGIELIVYDETWTLVKDRIMLLVNNGISGLILVVLILYLFLNGRVAFWVAVGIPVSFMATLVILYLAGGSINMISLFGLIMALGIIVDDAIVVGEDALAHHEMGESPLQSAEGGAHRMLSPVMASSLTTVGAFLPLMLIGGEMGNILFAIPLVIIAVIFASLLESFLVLPGHLKGALAKVEPTKPGSIRDHLEQGFDRFRYHYFKRLVDWALAHRTIVIAGTLAMMIVSIGLLAGGRLAFTFFPSPESSKMNANIQFVSGTPAEVTDAFLDQVYQALLIAEKTLEPGIIKTALVNYHQGENVTGPVHGSVRIELIDSEFRQTRNAEFIRQWRAHIPSAAGLENISIGSPKMGPPGGDIEIQFTGTTPQMMKQASLELQQVIRDIPGVSGIKDDLPYGRDQLVYKLTPEGEALGFTYMSLGQQLSSAFSSSLVQIYTQGEDEIEVRVGLPRSEQFKLGSLNAMQVSSPSGQLVNLNSVVTWQTQRGFDLMRHYNGRLAITVIADVDKVANNANRILQTLKETTLPELSSKYGVTFSFEGQAKRQKSTMQDMSMGLVLGLSLIYIVLAWVFASYVWPLVVMAAIPFGLVGAILGHWFTGIDLTILSLFGFFGLSGIVVNDSIILVSFYQRLRETGMGVNEALSEAAVQRVRAVLLTSLTTIAGLLPLLFETSLQAQFLIPMATSIAFGLLFSTVLILLVIPAMLSIYENWLNNKKLPVSSSDADKEASALSANI